MGTSWVYQVCALGNVDALALLHLLATLPAPPPPGPTIGASPPPAAPHDRRVGGSDEKRALEAPFRLPLHSRREPPSCCAEDIGEIEEVRPAGFASALVRNDGAGRLTPPQLWLARPRRGARQDKQLVHSDPRIFPPASRPPPSSPTQRSEDAFPQASASVARRRPEGTAHDRAGGARAARLATALTADATTAVAGGGCRRPKGPPRRRPTGDLFWGAVVASRVGDFGGHRHLPPKGWHARRGEPRKQKRTSSRLGGGAEERRTLGVVPQIVASRPMHPRTHA